MPKRYLVLLACLIQTAVAFAKHLDTAGYYEISVIEKRIVHKAPLIIAGETDSIRYASAWQLYRTMDTMLHMPAAMYYPFDSLRLTTVSILSPPDDKFRIFTFNLIDLAGNFKNFGYLEIRGEKETEIYPLLDTAKSPKKDYLESELETDQWYGALYYEIVPFTLHRKKQYMLIGYDGATAHSNKKVLDVLWFDNGTPVFGKSIFLDGPQDTKPACRVVFEFHNESHMLLRYEKERNIIVLDKLAPSFPEAVNDFYYYIPSGDYDFFQKNKKGYWVKNPLENYNLGQGERPPSPHERPRPEEPPKEHR